ncbi:MAG: ComF family protein [Patescibacteria group bacterium]
MFPFLIKIKEIIFDILFPPICVNCQKHLDDKNRLICEKCLSLIKINNTLFCSVCRARLAENKKICHRDAPYLLAAAGNYDDPVLQNLIHYFKYKKFENLAPILGELLIEYLKLLNFETFKLLNFIIVPIPLHPSRERERGFNQAKLLAEITASHFNLLLVDELKRIKNNEPQAKMKNSEKRTKNIFGCFEIKNSNLVKGKNIILVDDVFTSGATMNEAVKILKKNGAGKIIALVLAKA